MKTEEKALELHKRGYNCAQSVLCAFGDRLDMKEEDLFRISEGLGLGMGARETCGAVTGACLVAGLVNSDGNIDKPGTKKETYQLTRNIIEEFKKESKTVNCFELLGGTEGIPKKSCNDCIRDACRIAENVLFAK